MPLNAEGYSGYIPLSQVLEMFDLVYEGKVRIFLYNARFRC